MRNFLEAIYDFLTGRCVRRIKFAGSDEKALYLTFDDGPSPQYTQNILKLLKKHETPSTFFVIGKHALKYPELLKEIQNQGHTIGNHTIDHDTARYSQRASGINHWLNESEELLNSKLCVNSIGFRSPVGIKTPPLNRVLRQKKWPLILWDVRFYDTKYGLSMSAVQKKLSQLRAGSIILLHDTHPHKKEEEYLDSLEYLIIEAKKMGFHFCPITKDLVDQSYLEKYRSF